MTDRYGKGGSPDSARDGTEIDWETSMAEERARGGWSKVNSPVGGTPEPTSVFGSGRGGSSKGRQGEGSTGSYPDTDNPYSDGYGDPY